MPVRKDAINPKTRTAYRYWANATFYCPHCKKSFKYKEMWNQVGNDFVSLMQIQKVFNMDPRELMAILRQNKVAYKLRGTRQTRAWDVLAQTVGYRTAAEMFYDLRVIKKMSWIAIARTIDYDEKDVERLREVGLEYLKPKYGDYEDRRYGIRRFRVLKPTRVKVKNLKKGEEKKDE